MDPTRTGIFGMFFGAIRMTIAECIYGMFGVPFAALVVVIYRAVFLLVMFDFCLLLFGGFLYEGQFRGFSPKAFLTNFVDGNVVIHGTMLRGGCDFVGAIFLNNGALCGTDDVTPIFGVYNLWKPARKITAGEYAEHDRQVAAVGQKMSEYGRCELLVNKIGGTMIGGHRRWYQLTDAERASTTWPDFFRRIEPELKAERQGCFDVGPISNSTNSNKYYTLNISGGEAESWTP